MTTESVLKFDTVEENVESSFQVKTNFAEFKENFWEKTNQLKETSRQRKTNESAPTLETATRIATIKESTKSAKNKENNTIFIDEENTSTGVISLTTIDTEFVTEPRIKKSKKRTKWVAGEHPTPVVEEKLNRLTISPPPIIRRNRKPNQPSTRRINIARSKGASKISKSKIEKADKINEKEQENIKSRSAVRSRIRRPIGLKHQVNLNNIYKNKEPPVQMSIKRMRIKSKSRKAVKDQLNIDASSEGDTVKERPLHTRFRLPSSRRSHTKRKNETIVHKESSKSALHIQIGRTDSETTTSTSTTEKITISPNAHKISYTLNDSEYVETTSENPIVPADIPEEDEDEPSHPIAQELTSFVPIPDNMFSQATHQLLRANVTPVESFLPTLVPFVRRTPSSTVSHQVPIFEAGTRKSEKTEEGNKNAILAKPVKRGRYILAATING